MSRSLFCCDVERTKIWFVAVYTDLWIIWTYRHEIKGVKVHKKILEMKKRGCGFLGNTPAVIIFFFCLTSTLYAENDLHISNEFSLTHNHISGPGQASSSLTEGLRYLNVLGITGAGQIKGFDYNFNLVLFPVFY